MVETQDSAVPETHSSSTEELALLARVCGGKQQNTTREHGLAFLTELSEHDAL